LALLWAAVSVGVLLRRKSTCCLAMLLFVGKSEIPRISNAHFMLLQCFSRVLYFLNKHRIIYHILTTDNFVRSIRNIHNSDSRRVQ
jgi:hypothetical protein